ncbi:MAG TPA: hypothetical protein VGG64_12840 [Pirellulales bacterium]|jgi:guanyl-specific ribonuclease Sa
MTKRITSGLVASLLALALFPCHRAWADDGTQATSPPTATTNAGAAVAKSPAAAAGATTNQSTVNGTPQRQEVYRPRRTTYATNRARRSGPTNYNYSGVGFPGMEGGLTAAANRTTWGKPMYRAPRRRGW